MRYTTLGHSGLTVSRLCLGTMTFGRETTEAEAHAILDAFETAGGTFVDTADAYTDGASERAIGSWLRHRSRADFVIATKVRFGAGHNRRGLGRKHILQAVEGSLRRLGTDHIDLYQTHMWDSQVPLEETWSTLSGLVDAGKVRHLGVSNVTGWQLQRIIDVCRFQGWPAPISLQPLYNLLDRETEWELLPAATYNEMGVIPWSPLRGGWLTGKYRPGRGPEERPDETVRIVPGDAGPRWTESWANYDNPRTWHLLAELQRIADEAGRSCTAVALNWLLQQPAVTAPILGARTAEQIQPNLDVSDWALEPAQVESLDAAGRKDLPYPYGLLDDLADV